MLGEGLIGAGKSVVNNLANQAEGTFVGGPMTVMELGDVDPCRPALPCSNAYQAVGRANAPGVPTVGCASLAQGGLACAAPTLGTAYDAAAAWLSDAVDTIKARPRASADVNAEAPLQASVPNVTAETVQYERQVDVAAGIDTLANASQ